MKKNRRTYDKVFKQEAVSLVVEEGRKAAGWNMILLTALDASGNQKVTSLWGYRR